MKYSARLQIAIGFFSFFGFFIATVLQAHALNMSNSLYLLQMGNLNSFAGRKAGSGFVLQDTGGQLGAGQYTGTNYIIKAGFQYISSITRFKFIVSSQVIDFGTLSSSNPVTRTQTLTITNGSAYGYAVTAAENHQLLRPDTGSRIPDTTCDSGTCTASTPSTWTNPLTYGFGYRCDNVSGTPCVFTTANYYAPFANLEFSQTPQNVLAGTTLVKNAQATITFKANISGTQAPGNYINQINYVATPTF